MKIRFAILVLAAAMLAGATIEASAAMGLRCSDWLNARAHMRFDERTNRYVEINRPDLPPVPKEVDENGAHLAFYITGTVETLMWLDALLNKMSNDVGIQGEATPTVPAILNRVEELCRGSLQKDRRDADVLDVVSLNNQAQVLLRVQLIQTLMQKYLDAGRRQGR